MLKSTSFAILTLALMCCATNKAYATILTSPSQLSPTNTLIDFESFGSGLTTNPLIIGNATFSASTPLAIIDISSFTANGPLVFNKTLRSNGGQPLGSTGYVNIRIDFSSLINEVGLGWFDPNLTGNELQAYDSANNLLDTAPIPTGPPGGSFAAFRGISRAQNDISYVIAKVSTPNDVFSIDNISFGSISQPPQTTPEPTSTLGLLALGTLGAVSTLKRKLKPSQSTEKETTKVG